MSDVFHHQLGGESALVVVPELDEDLPEPIREGLARRRLVALGQACPCGARMPVLNRRERRAAQARRRRGLQVVRQVTVRHENDCPATGENLAALAAEYGLSLRRWT